MRRPPCCDCEKVGIKRGPWTPEEDMILVSYVQEHGPGKWRSVSVNTGLMRCSQSCRLRWTNYLRPGIKRGNFTAHEEDIIIQLQSLLGNRWAAIACYFPQRTDGDIKNYWYSHLKKKLDKQQAIGAISVPPPPSELPIMPTIIASHVDRHHDTTTNPISKDSYARPASSTPAAEVNTNCYYSPSSYASSMDNISELLNGFTKSSPTQGDTTNLKSSSVIDSNPLFPFDHMSSGALPPVSDILPPLMPPPSQQQQLYPSVGDWLFDDAAEQVAHQLMEISDGCCSVPMLL